MTGSIALGGLLMGFVTANSFDRMQPDAAPPRLTVVSDAAGSKTAQLLVQCAQADAKAFRQLYELCSAKLYGVALRITRNPALASDAVHDAMLQVWRNADRYSPDRGSADGWLVSLVRYRALDMIRKHGRETTGVDAPEQVDEDPDALSRLVADSDGAALRNCMEDVDPARRRLIVLAFIEGLTQSEVAVRVNQPLGTVKSTIRRVLMSLRSCLEQGAKVLRS
ncbi:sigma-70 family RNA polymerase sigma factor [Acidisphaera sp. L21]|jgi:RNA polymerase sigma-70 factor (ECF subfamily)|uniref:sigma-70 family RNA polymerase sigma factor n=1 Tax=Acidisphaera sp. L21 TaxID=1641851 RepID=UPI00131D1D41|nr:sigma-70 family RNA polymerase sigma factor [Acidisphaera sp. L21]